MSRFKTDWSKEQKPSDAPDSVLEDPAAAPRPGDTLCNLAGETIVQRRGFLPEQWGDLMAGVIRRHLASPSAAAPLTFVSKIPLSLRNPQDQASLRAAAKGIHGAVMESTAGKVRVSLQARQVRTAPGEPPQAAIIASFQRIADEPAPARTAALSPAGLFDRAAQIMNRARRELTVTGCSRMKLAVPAALFRDAEALRYFVSALNLSGHNPGGLTVKVAPRDQAAAGQRLLAAKAAGGAIELELESCFLTSVQAADLEPMAARIGEALTRAARRTPAAQVAVQLPARRVEHEAELAGRLYDLQMAHPGALKIKDPAGAHAARFARVRNVWVLAGDQADDLMPYKSAEAGLRSGALGSPAPAAQKPPALESERLKAKMLLALSSVPQRERRAVWLAGRGHSDETIAALADLKRKCAVSIVAAPEIKEDPRYRRLFEKPGVMAGVKATVQKAAAAVRGWFKWAS